MHAAIWKAEWCAMQVLYIIIYTSQQAKSVIYSSILKILIPALATSLAITF